MTAMIGFWLLRTCAVVVATAVACGAAVAEESSGSPPDATPGDAGEKAQSIKLPPPRPAPPIHPETVEFLLGTWVTSPKDMKPGQLCRHHAFMMRFYSDSSQRLRREFANAGSLLGAIFTMGLTALRSDDYVTRVTVSGDRIEVDSWSSPEDKAAVKARVLLIREGDGLRYKSHGRFESYGIAWSDPGINGGLYERCADKPKE